MASPLNFWQWIGSGAAKGYDPNEVFDPSRYSQQYRDYVDSFGQSNYSAPQKRRAQSAYAGLYGLDPIRARSDASTINPYTGQPEGDTGYNEQNWGANNPFRLDPSLVSYMDKTYGADWDVGLEEALKKVQLDPNSGGWGANYQRQVGAVADYLSKFDDPGVKSYATQLQGPESMGRLEDFATSQSKVGKANAWKSGLMAASVLSGPLMSWAGGALSSFLSPAIGEVAAPIASSALLGTGKSLLSNAVIGGALDDMPGPRQSTIGTSQPEAQQVVSTPMTSQPPLSESVMSTNARRPPLIRLTPGFRRGY